jgi:hypothetical protein
MRLLERAKSKAAGAIFLLLSLAFQTFPVQWWDRIPSRWQIAVLALGWTVSAWLAIVVLAYHLQGKLTLDNRGVLLDREGKPHCPICKAGLLVHGDSLKCLVHGSLGLEVNTPLKLSELKQEKK